MAEQNENFFTKYWNGLANLAIGIAGMLTDFVIPPKINAHILQDEINYASMSKFVLAGILGVFIILGNFFKGKKNTWIWALASVVFLTAAFIMHGRYNSYYNAHTAWHKEGNCRVITGDKYIPIAQQAIDAYEKDHPKLSMEDIVSSFNYHDGLWTNNELGRVYSNIAILYMAEVLLFALFAFSVVQAIYCMLNKTISL